MAACALSLPPPAQRARRRDELRSAYLQYRPDLSRRAAILHGAPAGTVDPAVPEARRTRLRHVLPSDLSRVSALAAGERHTDHPLRCDGMRDCAVVSGDPLLRLAAMVLPDGVRRSDPGPGRYRSLYHRARCNMPALRLSRAGGRRRLLQPRSHVRLLAPGASLPAVIPRNDIYWV